MQREFVSEDEKGFFFSGKRLPQIYLEYINYMKKTKKLSIGTIHNRKVPVLKFLLHFSNKNTRSTISKIKASEIQEYTMDKAIGLTRVMKRQMVTALRDFFRFLHFESYTEKDLSKSVPTIVTHRLSTIPKGMPWEVVEKLLQVPNRKTFSGKRDYAIILMFARYGVRSQQLRDLELSDIDWQNEKIVFAACKGGKPVTVPLFKDVAEALLAYFKAGRTKAPKKYKQVFLKIGKKGSSVSGQEPLHMSTWNIVSNALNRISGEIPIKFKRGPHAIRHAYATKLLDDGEPIKTISDLLGHASIHTTFVYTKSSLSRLRPITRLWPEMEV